MSDVVLFGFEPFLEFKENPAQLVVKSLDGKSIGEKRVKGVILPVVYGELEERIVSELRVQRPKLALGIGVAPGRNRVTPEKIAINLKHSEEPDNSGKVLEGAPIDLHEPDGIFTNLPVENLVKKLNAEGIPSSLSFSAGAYLCNFCMFVLIREARRSGFGGGFIHIPCHSEYVANYVKEYKNLPSLPLESIRKSIEIAIRNL
jgi:pyroglutamyl-peptidase